jgi:hypothetical protein
MIRAQYSGKTPALANIYRTPSFDVDLKLDRNAKARISSETSNSFILRVKIPALLDEEVDALVDSGATRCFHRPQSDKSTTRRSY